MDPANQPQTLDEDFQAVQFGFNSNLVANRPGINVEPRILRVNTRRYTMDKSIIYITNMSNDRQYIKLTSNWIQSLVISKFPSLEPGETLCQEITFTNLDFQLSKKEVAIYVYYSRVEHENLRLKHDGFHKVNILLVGPPVKKRKNEKVKPTKSFFRSPRSASSAPPSNGRPRDEEDEEAVEFKATIGPTNKTRSEQDELRDL